MSGVRPHSADFAPEAAAYARERHRLMAAQLPPDRGPAVGHAMAGEVSPTGYMIRDAGGVWRLR